MTVHLPVSSRARGGSGPSCHADPRGAAPGTGVAVVALAGAPNAGKSTLFNALTGARRTVGNWPGTTVEVGRGPWRLDETTEVDLVDLPGAYSLDALSPDEELTRDLLLADECGLDGGRGPADGVRRPDVVVLVLDAAHLARSLYLLAQLREIDAQVVLALTMTDIAARRGVRVDPRALSAATGAAVVALDPRRRSGLAELAASVGDELLRASGARKAHDLDGGDGHPGGCMPRSGRAAAPSLAGQPPAASDPDGLGAAEARFGWIGEVVSAATTRQDNPRQTWSDRIDRWVTAPLSGPLVFLAAMWLVFQITTTVAAPLQNGLEQLVTGPIAAVAHNGLGLLGLGQSWVNSLVVDGLIAGVGLLLSFVPLMALMFALLALLEDSGYLARAAVVTDRLMRSIGLPGRAFLPLVVGFGCNVPAISATRTLPDARHRVMTALLVPFTSCSARLTVYVLLASIFFPGQSGTVVFIMYLASVALLVLVGLALRSTLWRRMGTEPLLLDLPPYQRPTARLTAAVTWVRLRGFLRTASGIIVATVCLVWLMQAIPVQGGAGFGHVPVGQSLYAAAARTVAPALAPAGFGDWRTSSALMVGFVAKEAVVSSWAQTYAAAGPSEASGPGRLASQVRADFEKSSGGHPIPAVWAFLVFLLAYTPCMATLAAQKREIGLRWAAFGVAVQLSVAWMLAVAVFQVGRLLT